MLWAVNSILAIISLWSIWGQTLFVWLYKTLSFSFCPCSSTMIWDAVDSWLCNVKTPFLRLRVRWKLIPIQFNKPMVIWSAHYPMVFEFTKKEKSPYLTWFINKETKMYGIIIENKLQRVFFTLYFMWKAEAFRNQTVHLIYIW